MREDRRFVNAGTARVARTLIFFSDQSDYASRLVRIEVMPSKRRSAESGVAGVAAIHLNVSFAAGLEPFCCAMVTAYADHGRSRLPLCEESQMPNLYGSGAGCVRAWIQPRHKLALMAGLFLLDQTTTG